jgi:hypothetical protein
MKCLVIAETPWRFPTGTSRPATLPRTSPAYQKRGAGKLTHAQANPAPLDWQRRSGPDAEKGSRRPDRSRCRPTRKRTEFHLRSRVALRTIEDCVRACRAGRGAGRTGAAHNVGGLVARPQTFEQRRSLRQLTRLDHIVGIEPKRIRRRSAGARQLVRASGQVAAVAHRKIGPPSPVLVHQLGIAYKKIDQA